MFCAFPCFPQTDFYNIETNGSGHEKGAVINAACCELFF